MKCSIYCRVSDDKKKDDGQRRQDVDRQIQMLRDYCSKLGYDEATEYVDDGKSAFTEDLNVRPAFKQLLNDVRRKFVTQIFIEDMTRFSRKLDMGLQWLKLLGQYQCNLTSLKEGELEVTSSKGWLQSSMLLMFAEWSSRVQSEKVKSGMSKASNLKKHIGRPKEKGGSESGSFSN